MPILWSTDQVSHPNHRYLVGWGGQIYRLTAKGLRAQQSDKYLVWGLLSTNALGLKFLPKGPRLQACRPTSLAGGNTPGESGCAFRIDASPLCCHPVWARGSILLQSDGLTSKWTDWLSEAQVEGSAKGLAFNYL